jgi:primosomal protein N' (replication factor Y)
LNKIVCVALPTPLPQCFDYLTTQEIKVGCRVIVPWGSKSKVGVVVENKQNSDYDLAKLKTVSEVLDETPIFDEMIFEVLKWTSKYYHHPLGEVIATAIPKRLREGKEAVIKLKKQEEDLPEQVQLDLNEAQIEAVEIVAKVNEFKGFLLHGVTGSGKTEVYLSLVKQQLGHNKQVLVLIPEIGLTPQMVFRFEQRLQTKVAVFHSQLTEVQKLNTYLLAKNGDAKVILGTRSAIFMPIKDLGLIVVDEEHDDSFKQQSGLRYSARDLSYIRAQKSDIPLVLGTATPSLETLNNVLNEKITRITLKNRAGKAKPPKITIVDMRGNYNGFSDLLLAQMHKTLAKGKQVMLFINRRGYAPVYYCKACQWRAQCEDCSTGLVYHRGQHRLKCHHCGLEQQPKNICPKCGENQMDVLGQGTEKVEDTLFAHFPKMPIIRIDRDTTSKKKQMENNLKKIHSGESCIIVGTQMLAKGHDFTQLSLVGILDIDAGFLSVDFRSTEKLAQLLLQVAGRSGRKDDLGEVYIQTQNPHHEIFDFINKNLYTQYANLLLNERKQAFLPPFSFQCLVCANAKNKENAVKFLEIIAQWMKNQNIQYLEVMGPVSARMEKKAGYFYVHLWLQSNSRSVLQKSIPKVLEGIQQEKLKSKVRWYLDIDPIEN